MMTIKRHTEHFKLPRVIHFCKEKVIRSCAHLMLVTQSGSGNKFHQLHFLVSFRSCPLPEIVLDKYLKTSHPIYFYRSSNVNNLRFSYSVIQYLIQGLLKFMHKKKHVFVIRNSGHIVNRSGFIRAGIKRSRASVGYE
jgi:hypothetical protein